MRAPVIQIRLVDDPHLLASALYDEVKALGFPLSYVTFARQLLMRSKHFLALPLQLWGP